MEERGERKMLFMCMMTFDPERRDEITKRRLEKGTMAPEGVKHLGEWLALRGHLVFELVETDDPNAIFAMLHAWSDLMRFDLLPVMAIGSFKELVKE